jgi:hypothetical protein
VQVKPKETHCSVTGYGMFAQFYVIRWLQLGLASPEISRGTSVTGNDTSFLNLYQGKAACYMLCGTHSRRLIRNFQSYFLHELRKGHTPSPSIESNNHTLSFLFYRHPGK